jgi:hypothetical protein
MALVAIHVPIPASSGERVGVVEAGRACAPGEVASLEGKGPVWGCVLARSAR